MASSEKFKYSEITRKIIGAAMKVHRTLGYGFPEVVYKRALLIELKKMGMNCQAEIEKPIIYDDIVIYTRKVDIMVEGVVLTELKAVREVDSYSVNQN